MLKRSSKTGLRLWATLSLLFVLLAAALVGVVAYVTREQAIARAQQQLRSVVLLMTDHADRALQDGDKLLRALAPVVKDWDLQDAAHARQIFDAMHNLMSGSPQIASAWVLNSQGVSVLDSWAYPPRTIVPPERDYFKAHQQGAANPVVGRLEVGSVTAKPRFTISRSVKTADGKLHAVVVVAIYSDYFQQLYEQAITEPDTRGGIFLMDTSYDAGSVLARAARQPQASAEYLRALMQRMHTSSSGAGVFAESDGTERVGAWQRSDEFKQVFASASQGGDAALVSWRTQLLELFAASTVATILFSIMAYLGIKVSAVRALASHNELLLKEVHHRVKNNLQIMSSLISLRGSAARTAESKDLLAQIGGDLNALAEAFSLLYQGSGASGTLDLSELISRLCSYLSSALGKEVVCKCDGTMVVNADRALNLGIVVNELITNAVKHSDRPIAVSCGTAGEYLRVKVLGGMMPDDEVLQTKPERFGIKMVKRLVIRAGGKLETDANGIEIRFPN